MNHSRRSFLQNTAAIAAAAVAAPYVITTPGLLMPVKKLWVPWPGKWHTEFWIRHDGRALTVEEAQALFASYRGHFGAFSYGDAQGRMVRWDFTDGDIIGARAVQQP